MDRDCQDKEEVIVLLFILSILSIPVNFLYHVSSSLIAAMSRSLSVK